jgi:DNA-binding response OmpR family regulator
MTEQVARGGVLVVDDEDEILELLEEYLKVRGYQVWTARNGEQALERLSVEAIDVVLTDMKMPSLGGIELLEKVSELPRPMAVVMMTGFGTVETAIQAMKLGAADYILKPFKLRDIHGALTHANARVESIRVQRLDAGLRSFYEHCNDLEDEDLTWTRQVLVELLVKRLGVSAAGIWKRVEGSYSLEYSFGLAEGLDELESCIRSGSRQPTNSQRLRELSSGERILGVQLEQESVRPVDAGSIDKALHGLCKALVLAEQRLT